MTLTAEGVREILDYDPANGVFRWISGRLSGSLAGTDQNQGYRHIAIAGRKHLAHRLAWLYIYDEWPAGNLDHINGIRNDNRISNLRIASPSQNAANAKSKAPRSRASGARARADGRH